MEVVDGDLVVGHQFRLMEELWLQKMEGKFCDVVIKVLEYCVSIHSCVLAAFTSGNLFNDNLTNVIEIDIFDTDDLIEEDKPNKDLCSDALDKIINFIYRGKLHFEEKNVKIMQKIAENLQLQQVQDLCSNFMTEQRQNMKEKKKTSQKQTKNKKMRRPTPHHNLRITPSGTKNTLIKRYTCATCGFFALKVKPLLIHLKEKRHEGTTCSLCNFQATSNAEILEHLEKHEDEKPFFCFSCNARFRTRTALNLHLPKHSNEKPYICNECGKGFKWKHALHNHVMLHTDGKQHLCDQCGYRTAHQSSFKAHCLLHSGDTFKCVYPGCNFQAARKQNLKQHAKTHSKEKPFQCEVCGHAFSLVKNLRRHARIHNANENLIRCCSCEFSTTRVDKLKEHDKKHHSKSENVCLEIPDPDEGANLDPSIIIADSDGQIINFPTLQLFPLYTLVTNENHVGNKQSGS
uniref:BTB domain-containing protein n=1 Tax=Strigamia maritima TaxID=126957 RepID=T1JC01_STRMM